MIHSQQRVVVVTGATGTGKSKLGVDLALALRPIVECEIVSCDAMQVYNGLTIATNQITPEEQCGVPHHLIGCQDALNPIDVVEFARRAWQCIEQIHQRGHLPIIVAGTLYYLEAILGLLIPQSRPSNNNNNNQRISDDQNEEERRISEKKQLEDVEEWKKLSDEEVSALLRTKSRKELIEWTTQQNTTFLFSILERLDPIRARKLHPHDTRRVVNSLLTYVENGRTHSAHISESITQAKLRYRVCVIALQCDYDILNTRLKHRIDTMLTRGLIDEIVALYKRFVEQKREVDFTQGILQSIGFKEFATYLQFYKDKDQDKDKAESEDEEQRRKILDQALNALHRHTLHYARKQNRWLRNHFAPRLQQFQSFIYLLDSSQLSQWTEAVVLPATRIVSQFLKDAPIEWSQIVTPQSSESLDEWKKYECKICGRILNGAREWTEHLNSRQHHRRCQNQSQTQKRKSPASSSASSSSSSSSSTTTTTATTTIETESSSFTPLPNFSTFFQSENSNSE